MIELLEDDPRNLASLPRNEQDAITSQTIETLEDEAAWKETLAVTPEKLSALSKEALREPREAKAASEKSVRIETKVGLSPECGSSVHERGGREVPSALPDSSGASEPIVKVQATSSRR
jgi:hypothetical protein